MRAEQPLATELRKLWARVDRQEITTDSAMAEQERLLNAYRQIWFRALLLNGETDIVHSTLRELASRRGIQDLESVRRRCEQAVQSLKDAWNEQVKSVDTTQVEQFYDEAEHYIEELMWWHTLRDDDTPLAYVAAMKFAAAHDVQDVLDFGSGVGSGGLLFVNHGFKVTLADISSVLLDFAAWRFAERKLAARFIDLKTGRVPEAGFDFITAMDVFEHLTEPVEAIATLAEALKPGGYIFGRFAGDIDPDRPMHIVQDFGPVFAHLEKLGFSEVWKDDWLWGHQVFQKPAHQ
jgi:mycofactocin glycosyltransferase